MTSPVNEQTRDIGFLTTSQYEDLVVFDRRRHGRLDIPTYVQAKKPSFLNSVILYYGRDMADISDTIDQVTDQVQDFIHLDLICKLAEDPRFKGSAVSCGSTSEGVKVRIPNEFDFIFEVFPDSLNSDHLVLEPVMPETFRPRKVNSNVYERTFFRIGFNDDAASLRNWDSLLKCKDCLNVESCNRTHMARYLCPRAVQNALAATVERSVSTVAAVRRCMSQVDDDKDDFGRHYATERSPLLLSYTTSEVSLNCDPPQPSMVKRNGPAVSCYTRSETLPHPGVVKIDITFAIPFHRHPGQVWPLEHFKHMTLCDHVTARGQVVDKCYLVPAGDYWRVTFVSHEQKHMMELLEEDNKKYCFQAVKCLRDELSLTDDYESALLSSYPLKVSFMKEQLMDPNLWPDESLADHAISMLGRVEQQGTSKTLTSFYIQDDPLFPGDSDHSHIETRRMLYYLNEQTKVYFNHGSVHAVLWLLFTIWQITLGVASSVVLVRADLNESIATRSITISANVMTLFPSIHILFSILTFANPIFGLIWIRASRSTVLYKLYKGVIITYVVMVIFGTIQLSIAITLLVLKEELLTAAEEVDLAHGTFLIIGYVSNDEFLHAEEFLWGCWCSGGISIAVFLAVVSHFMIITVCGREVGRGYPSRSRRRKHIRYFCLFHCEIVFFDDVYRSIGRRKRPRGYIIV